MFIDEFEYDDKWSKVKQAARQTISRDGAGTYPTKSWKKKILLAEHSPIRKIKVDWRWADLMYWVSVHFVRHKFGIEHFVTTQRTDRTGTERNSKTQDALVKHQCEANAQALINISRKRLCSQASPETRAAWKAVKEKVTASDPVLGSVMVPECIYRGFCPEMTCCGYVDSDVYKEALAEYRNTNINNT